MATRITEGGGRGGSAGSMGSKKVKVSPNVTVVAPKRKKISIAETLRLGNLNKPTPKLKPKYQAKANKAEAKTMKAAAKPKPKTDTMYTRSTNKASDPFAKTKVSARDLAKEAVAKRAGRAYEIYNYGITSNTNTSRVCRRLLWM